MFFDWGGGMVLFWYFIFQLNEVFLRYFAFFLIKIKKPVF